MSDVDPILNQSRRFQKFRNTLIRIIPRIPNDRVSLQATSMSSQAAMASASTTPPTSPDPPVMGSIVCASVAPAGGMPLECARIMPPLLVDGETILHPYKDAVQTGSIRNI